MTEGSGAKESEARQCRDCLRKMAAEDVKMIFSITQILEGMQDFCRSKKNMYFPIREGITEVMY